MKKTIGMLAIALACFASGANASYTAIYPSGGDIKFTKYTAYTPVVSDWVNSGSPTDCTWTPLENTVAAGTSFTQTGNNCKQTQTRTVQERERDELSSSIRNKGSATVETQNITVSSTRTAVGSKAKEETCLFGGGKAYWLESGGTTRIIWYSDNVDISYTDGKTSYIYNGYTYTRGTYFSIEGNASVGYTAYYYACRS